MRMYVYISFDTESKFVLSTLTSKNLLFFVFSIFPPAIKSPPPPPSSRALHFSLPHFFISVCDQTRLPQHQTTTSHFHHTYSLKSPPPHTLSLFSFVSSALSLSLSPLFLPYPLFNLARPFLLDLTLVFPLTLTLIHMLRSTAMSLSKSNLNRGTFRDVLLSRTKKVAVCLFIAFECCIYDSKLDLSLLHTADYTSGYRIIIGGGRRSTRRFT